MSSFRVLCAVLLLSVAVLGLEVDNTRKTTTKHTTTTSPTTTTPTTTTSTTTAPTTTTPPPTTTTALPTTTTTIPITTTVAPPPSPPSVPEKGKWAFYDKNNDSCVIVQIAAQLNITYQKKDNSKGRAIFNMPVNITKVNNGSCEEPEQFIVIEWPSSTDKNFVTFRFNKNSTANLFSLISMEFNISKDSSYFPDAIDDERVVLTHSKIFTIPLQKSYRCAKKQTITLERNSTVMVKDLQIEAYHKDKGMLFDSATDCDSDVPDVVPIAVGCALGALVLIILITYLVGRRRSQTSGYLSM